MSSFTVFEICGQEFAVETGQIIEAVKVEKVFPVPGGGEVLEGVMNLRNNVIPLFNGGLLVKGERSRGETALIITTERGNLAILVDRIKGIEKVDQGNIKRALKKKTGDLNREFIRGLFEKEGKPIFLLKVEPLINKERGKKRIHKNGKDFSSQDISKQRIEDNLERKKGFLIFTLGSEWFAFPVEDVNEIIEFPSNVSEVPDSPDHVIGVFIFRGKQMTLVSLRNLIGVEEGGELKRSVVSNLGNRNLCIAVDDVKEIRWVEEESILRKEDSMGYLALNEGRRIVLVLSMAEILDDYEIQVGEEVEKDLISGGENMRSFVGFEVGNVEFAIPIEKVKEVVEIEEVTALPEAPDYIEGVYNLRNSVIVILSILRKLGISSGEESNRVIVLEDFPVGLKVSKLKGILRASEDSIQAVEKIRGIEKDVFDGVIKSEDGRIVFMLDTDSFLKKSDFDPETIGEIVKTGEGHEEGR